MLIRHSTSGLFWTVNDDGEVSLATEGTFYVTSPCVDPTDIAPYDPNFTHLMNTFGRKCICRIGDKLVEAHHDNGVSKDLFQWNIVDGMIKNYQGSVIDGDLTLIGDKSQVPINVQASTTPAEEAAPAEVEEAVQITEKEEEAPPAEEAAPQV